MGTTYKGILLYGIKHEWNEEKINEIYEKDEEYYEDHSLIKIPFPDTNLYFVKIHQDDCKPCYFICLRYYESETYKYKNIDLAIPFVNELRLFQNVLSKLGIPKQDPEWYLVSQGSN